MLKNAAIVAMSNGHTEPLCPVVRGIMGLTEASSREKGKLMRNPDELKSMTTKRFAPANTPKVNCTDGVTLRQS